MSMEEKQRVGAMRLFEALSGVDESLLIKCEDAETEGVEVGNFDARVVDTGSRIIGWNKIFGSKMNLYRVAGILAAAVCLIAVGITWWSATPKFISQDNASSAECAVEDGVVQTAEEAAPAEAPAAAQEAVNETFREEALWDAEMSVAGSTESVEKSKVQSNVSESGSGKSEDTKYAAGSEEQELNNAINHSTDKGAVGAAPIDTRKDITLSQACAVNLLGEYVPDVVPAGYVWEFGKATENAASGQVESISLCWVNGMDSIEISITKADVISVTLTDTDVPESYNVHLYEIPYADTVPEKYREQFIHPVFRAEDMSLDIVKARMKSVSDVGDTDTPRGNFAVLYEDDVLVSFRGRGSAEDIWKMFAK